MGSEEGDKPNKMQNAQKELQFVDFLLNMSAQLKSCFTTHVQANTATLSWLLTVSIKHERTWKYT